MKLRDLVNNYKYKDTIGSLDVEISGLEFDSRNVKSGGLFFCLRGKNENGEKFVYDAINKGAAAVVTQTPLSIGVPQIIARDCRDAFAKLSAQFYGNPAEKLKMIAVVGTNGKTTTCHIIKSILEKKGLKTGLIGTIGVKYNDKTEDSILTTPDPPELNKILSEMVLSGVKYVVMEVSAHAIKLQKLNGIIFSVAVFTNFSQDHLDFFESMEEYKNTKISFFDPVHCEKAVVNADDPAGLEIIRNAKIPVLSYGADNPSDVFAVDITADDKGIKYVINMLDMLYEFSSGLLAEFNVYNSLAAACCCKLLGIGLSDIASGIAAVNTVDGRMQRVEGTDKNIIVDFAHTPDGLEKVLLSLKKLCKNKLICLFGCGGNRDKLKRPVMGGIAGKHSDFVILTSDNPRFEDPVDIIKQIEHGLKEVNENYVAISDRRAAIEYALSVLEDGDMLLLAGKGNEKYQDVMGTKHDFNDIAVVRELLKINE